MTEQPFEHRVADFASRPTVLFITLLPILGWILQQHLDADPDLFARVAVGHLIETTGEVPAVDPFAFSKVKPQWIDHEWLSGVVFYQLARFGGDWLLFLFKGVMAALTALVLLRARLVFSGQSSVASVVFVYVMLLSSYVWTSTVRSQVFTYLFLPVTFWLIGSFLRRERDRIDRAWLPLVAIPPMIAMWAQLHGGFVLGLGLLGLFLLDDARRNGKGAWPVAVILAMSCGGVLLHPAGTDYLVYLADSLTMARPAIPEWGAVSIASPIGMALAVLAISALFGMYRRKCYPPLFASLFIGVALLYAWRHERLVAVFAMSLYAMGGRGLEVRLGGQLGERALARAIRGGVGFGWLGASTLALVVGATAWLEGPFRLDLKEYPVAASEWLRSNRDGGRLLAGFNSGSFLLWRLHPEFLVAIDGRYEECYPDETVANAAAGIDPSHPNHTMAIKELHPDWILVKTAVPYDQVPSSLRFDPSWRAIYQDDRFLLLERGDGEVDVAHEFITGPIDLWSPRF